jgi:hypothetical protein
MTTLTQLSRSDTSIATSPRTMLRGRHPEPCNESPGVTGPVGQPSFAYFHLRKLARRLVNDPVRLAQWWDCGGIEELGAMTPAQLLATGKHEQLEVVLHERIARLHA